MALAKIGGGHSARKQLFQSGLRRGFLTVQEIEDALPSGSLTAAERWLLYYSLRAAQIEIRDEAGASTGVPPLSEEELARLESERQGRHGAVEQAEEALSALEEAPPDREPERPAGYEHAVHPDAP